MDELDDARSEWARVYFSVLMSSVRGALKATRFGAGNMGRVVVKEARRLGRGRGPLARIERVL